ncbi:LysR family transcriptional regulator [Agrobacterium sp. Ap1]|uniref:LysR family transcriptional regulator n=1 Tax=Agrobacterium sp. Ap1 TaxID=2815337 RepID=UPI001A8D7D8D|nr:LysR family transcriptional regulator [Agrobacterium sp. Ap1]MBO0144516.1 LysR family transcriptional regulator [Agrobacterium sp. Ap1]
MEWSDIRIFLAVARHGTLGGAARALHLSHPTVGRRLRALEDATGQILFQKTADGFILTEEGISAMAAAEQMEEAAMALDRTLTGKETGMRGTLRVTSPDWFGAWLLPPVIAEFTSAHPRVDLELLTGTKFLSLAQREADVAFRIREFTEADIIQRRLIAMPYGVYVANGKGEPKLGDGEGFGLVTMDGSLGTFDDVAWLRDLFPKARVALRSNNRNVQARMSAAGVGICVLPRPVGDRQAELVRLDIGEDPPGRDVWMGYHRDLKQLGRLRAFVEMTIHHLAS